LALRMTTSVIGMVGSAFQKTLSVQRTYQQFCWLPTDASE